MKSVVSTRAIAALPSLAEEIQPSADKHIVDLLIEERAQKLRRIPPLWWAIRHFLYPVLRYKEAIKMADSIAQTDGHESMAELCRQIPVNLEVSGLENVPQTGRVMIVGNHPSGIVDGIALYEALMRVRSDLSFFANRDAIRVAPGLLDLLIPVEWVNEKRNVTKTKEMVKHTAHAFKQDQAVVIFPSGGIARMTKDGLRERPWLNTTLNLIRKYQTPVVPLRITAKNSWLYYFFHQFSDELRNMTLFYEMLNKRGETFKLQFGPIIQVDELDGDVTEVTERLRDYVEFDLTAGRAFGA